MGVSLTGDPLMDELLPVALRVVGAVHRQDDGDVAAAIVEARALWGERGPRGADAGTAHYAALIVLLAAMVPEDEPASALLAWRADEEQVARYVEAGISRDVAMAAVRARAGRG